MCMEINRFMVVLVSLTVFILFSMICYDNYIWWWLTIYSGVLEKGVGDHPPLLLWNGCSI